MDYNVKIQELVDKGTNNIKKETVTLNNGMPIFNKCDYEIVEGEPIYFKLDEYGRSNGAMALLSKNTIPLIIKKKLNYPDPYGWSKNLEGKYLFERCHIIAYSLSAKLADKSNLFIGTSNLNTSIMIKIENKIKKYINENNVRVLYRVTIKYKGKNQIPTGILIEAKSLEDSFSICEFCYNVEKNVKFKYTDGTIIEDKRILPILKQSFNKLRKDKVKDIKEKNTNYIINRKTNEFHLYTSNCKKLNNVESKYIQETTATSIDLKKANLKPCHKCIDTKM